MPFLVDKVQTMSTKLGLARPARKCNHWEPYHVHSDRSFRLIAFWPYQSTKVTNRSSHAGGSTETQILDDKVYDVSTTYRAACSGLFQPLQTPVFIFVVAGDECSVEFQAQTLAYGDSWVYTHVARALPDAAQRILVCRASATGPTAPICFMYLRELCCGCSG